MSRTIDDVIKDYKKTNYSVHLDNTRTIYKHRNKVVDKLKPKFDKHTTFDDLMNEIIRGDKE